MVFSFVNLVSWRFFCVKHLNHKVYLDSASIRFVARLHGRLINEAQSISGVKYFSDNRKTLTQSILLGAEENKTFTDSYVLPFWKDSNDIALDENIIEAIGDHKVIVIGISSPKQEILARKIYDKIGPNIEIYCLGAAINFESSSDSKSFSFLWFKFLLQSPQRTLGKIELTFKEMVLIFFRRRRSREFLEFCDNYLK